MMNRVPNRNLTGGGSHRGRNQWFTYALVHLGRKHENAGDWLDRIGCGGFYPVRTEREQFTPDHRE
jgi:hypothetical protein